MVVVGGGLSEFDAPRSAKVIQPRASVDREKMRCVCVFHRFGLDGPVSWNHYSIQDVEAALTVMICMHE